MSVIETPLPRPRGWSVPDWVYPTAALLVLLTVWQAVVVIMRVPERLVPAPTVVAEEMIARFGLIFRHAQLTLLAAALGCGAAFAVGLPLALLISSSRLVARWVTPLLSASHTIPKVAVAPLLVIFFGYDLLPRVIVAFLAAFFPIVIQTLVGLKGLPHDLKLLAQSMGASWVQTTLKIRLMYAAPSILSGLRIAVPLAFAGALTGEFVAPRNGLGYVLTNAALNYDGRLTFAAIVALVILTLFFFVLIDVVERTALRWHASHRRDTLGGSL
jgi:NitT/TauT family transport system permease protein